MTAESHERDVAAARAGIEAEPFMLGTHSTALAALDRLSHALREAEGERDHWKWDHTEASKELLARAEAAGAARAALELVVARQLTPLDVAATHIDILRRKSDEYSAGERDNVAAMVESHVREARDALFAALAAPDSARVRQSGPGELLTPEELIALRAPLSEDEVADPGRHGGFGIRQPEPGEEGPANFGDPVR